MARSRLRIDSRGLGESGLQNIYIRSVDLNIGRLVLNLSILTASGDENPLVPELSFKAIVCLDRNLAENIIRRQELLTNDFDRPGISFQRVYAQKQETFFDYSMRTFEGTSIFKKSISLVFDIPQLTEGDLQHLSCIVAPVVLNPSKSTKTYDKTQTTYGRMVTEIIYDDFQLKTNANVLYTGNTTIWPGSIHKLGDYKTESRNRKSSRKLSDSSVVNSKINDYRIFQGIYNSTGELNQSRNLEDFEMAKFTNIFLTSDENRRVKILFGLDCKEIYRGKAEFPRIIENESMYSQFVSAMNKRMIEEISVFRYRSEQGPSKRKLIATSRDSLMRKLVKKTHIDGEKEIGTIEEVYLNTPFLSSRTGEVRYMVVTDLQMAEEGLGEWNYSVEVKVRDLTGDFFKNKHIQLTNSLNDLERYTTASSRHMNYKANAFNQSFFENNLEQKESLLTRCLVSYIENIVLTQDVSPQDIDRIASTLNNITHPVSGNILGLEYFIELMKKQSSKNLELIKKTNILSKKKVFFNTGIEHIKEEKKIIHISHDYSNKDESYLNGCLNETGMEYLYKKGRIPSRSGLLTLSLSDWKRRIVDENKKYSISRGLNSRPGRQKRLAFNTEALEDTYISPNFVRSGGNELDLEVEAKNHEYVGLNTLLISRKEDKKSFSQDRVYNQNTIKEEETTANQMLHLFHKKSISLLSPDELRRIKAKKSILVKEEQKKDSSKYLNRSSDFNNTEKERKKHIEATISKKKRLLKETSKVSPLLLDVISKNVSNDTRKKKDNQTRPRSQKDDSIRKNNQKLNLANKKNAIDTIGDLTKVPNQIVSLITNTPASFKKSKNIDGFARDYLNSSEFNLKYNTLRKVEAMVRFKTSVRDSIWAPLDKRIINQMNGALLCRIVTPYVNKELGIENELSCPAFNEYFILGNSVQRSSRGNVGSGMVFIPKKLSPVLPEFLNSSLNMLPESRGRRRFVAGSNKAPLREPMKRPGAGRTSSDAEHFHFFQVDENGNGVAIEAVHPEFSHIRHSHLVKNWTVLPASSQVIDPVNGVPKHVHKLNLSTIQPTSQGDSRPSRSTASPGQRTTGTPAQQVRSTSRNMSRDRGSTSSY